jgi:DNA helicase-2/ATP-dependent DNA helicase PcrA
MRGVWSSNMPSRFLDELPEASVEVSESNGGFADYGNIGASRFDDMTHFSSGYTTPGWQRAQRNRERRGFDEAGEEYTLDEETANGTTGFAPGANAGRPRPGRRRRTSRVSRTIEGELVAKSAGIVSEYAIGDRVFHQKFGNGNVTGIDGNKLVVRFDRAGEKRVVDSYVQRV